jgi:glycerol-3-phosphate acyltransferase PlsY
VDQNQLESELLRPLIVIIIAYLLGSIPFGFLIVRKKVGADIRETGSGGTGATNVSRRAGKAAGVFTLVLDALKGAVAVEWAVVLAGPSSHAAWIVTAAAIAVIVGHIFPVWLGFRGGKGVATGFGVFLMLAPIALLCAGMLFVAIVALTRYVSLGSMVAAATIPLFVWFQSLFVRQPTDLRPLLIAAIVCAALIVFAHRGNIGRLAHGTEAQI